MTSVTQTVPTLTGGLSQQPDELKIPGQVSVANNVIPDVTHGLLKRPGGKLVASISDNGTSALNSNTNGKWFSYYRDETESYIGQVSRSGDINMWRCSDGASIAVNYTTNTATALANYLTHTNDEDIQTLTLNDFTFITNRTKTVAMSNTVETVRPPEIFIDLQATAYARQYAVNLYDNLTTQTVTTATRISVDLIKSSNNYCNSSGNMVSHNLRHAESTRCGTSAADSRDAYAPNVGTRIFNISSGTQLTDTGAVSTQGNTDYDYIASVYRAEEDATAVVSASANTLTVTKNGHDYLVGEYFYCEGNNVPSGRYQVASKTTNTFTATYNTSTNVTTEDVKIAKGDQADRTSLYFRIRTTGQSVPFTEGSGSNQTTTYQARYTTTFDLLYGGLGWQQGDHIYVFLNDAMYKVNVDLISTQKIQANLGLIRPNPTPFDTETSVTSSSILGDIRTAILGTSHGGTNASFQFRDDPSNGYEVKMIGNGLYITRPASDGTFNITAPSSDLLKVMSTEVKNVDDLPDQCKHGYVVKVANSEADEDDYYVKFFGNNDRDGDGVWEECSKPGRKIEFDKGTMPVQLVRQANGTFTVEQVTWDDCEVGDDLTNPEPSFVGENVNQLVFFRNRLVILSEENVIMSRPGDFFNFWSKTATTFTPEDVIDLSCSSTYPAIVYAGIQINAGLLLFTKNQQFMLTTDSDILSPETAKINAVSSYNFNEKTNPVSLGTTVAFIDNANKYSRFFEMSNVLRQGEPDVVDQSKVISSLLDKDISIVSESRENSVVFFSKKGTDKVFGFRYHTSGDKRLLQAWFTWTVAGEIQYHCMLDDALFVVTRNNNKDQIVKYSLKLDDTGHFVTDTNDTVDTSDDYIYRVHLDHSTSVTAGSNTYNAATIKTTIPKPNGLESTKQLVAYETDAGNDLGRYALVTVNSSNLEIAGDWSSNTFVIGYLYEMDVQLPTLYVTRAEGSKFRSDAKSSLIIHRIKFSFGPLGVYSTTLKRIGKPDYTETKELALAGVVSASRLPIVSEVIETVPCYERNTNLTVNIKSSHPAPATLISLAWEGDFTNRFYKRV